MSDTAFTPAPWRVDEDDRPGMAWNRHIYAGHSNRVCFMSNTGDDPIGAANAHLIAAAPELYEACESAIPSGVCLTNRNIPDDFTVSLDCTMGNLRKIAAALAKARGEQVPA